MVELIIGFFIVAIALLVLYSTFAGSYRSAVMTRNRIAANYVTNSFFEEVYGHRFGQDKPGGWPTATIGPVVEKDPPGDWMENGQMPDVQELDVYIDGRPQKLVFYRQLFLANGSLIGKGSGENWDEATLVVTWREKGDQDNPGGLKTLTSKMLARRHYAVRQ